MPHAGVVVMVGVRVLVKVDASDLCVIWVKVSVNQHFLLPGILPPDSGRRGWSHIHTRRERVYSLHLFTTTSQRATSAVHKVRRTQTAH